jgi:sorbitol-specific phosphotransferase system component IIBC
MKQVEFASYPCPILQFIITDIYQSSICNKTNSLLSDLANIETYTNHPQNGDNQGYSDQETRECIS